MDLLINVAARHAGQLRWWRYAWLVFLVVLAACNNGDGGGGGGGGPGY